MADAKPRRKKSPTEELFHQVLAKIDRQDKRLASIEQLQVLNQNELVRHGKLMEEINARCMEQLGRCLPAPSPDDEDGNGNGEAS